MTRHLYLGADLFNVVETTQTDPVLDTFRICKYRSYCSALEFLHHLIPGRL